MVSMNTLYKTEISDVRWMAYDIPGNVGWIAYLICDAERQPPNLITKWAGTLVGLPQSGQRP